MARFFATLLSVHMVTAAVQPTVFPRQEVSATGSVSSTATTSAAITAVTSCHLHDSELLCVAGTTEYVVGVTVTQTTDVPASYTGCHSHSGELYCMDENGDDVSLEIEGTEHEHSEEEATESEDTEEEMDCHFHAGVEHCVSKSGSSSGSSSTTCERVDRDYHTNLRIGLLFVILATSAIGVFGPIVLASILPDKLGTVFVLLKQFGTGVVISTALVHLLTHATLMFENECLGALKYEATSTSIMMAGIFVSFLVEYSGHRYVSWKMAQHEQQLGTTQAACQRSHELINITVMEAGIVFHSLLIGLTLVVTGDSAFMTLFIVIIFHQMFEGIALGSRIAALGTGKASSALSSLGHHHEHPHKPESSANVASITSSADSGVSMRKKLALAAMFALVTPIGMAIGIGVLNQFNGNDKSTIVAIGTLDAFSAGILMWVGLVEMWAGDWVHGELANAGPLKTGLGMIGLVSGMVLMSLLGKWA